MAAVNQSGPDGGDASSQSPLVSAGGQYDSSSASASASQPQQTPPPPQQGQDRNQSQPPNQNPLASPPMLAHLQQQHQRSVKRPRPVKSCTECRKRKLRCDRLCPCSQCQKSNRPCRYAADHESANLSDGSDTEMVEPPRPTKRSCAPGASVVGASTTVDASNGPVKVGDGITAAVPLLEELSLRMERLEKQLHLARSPARTDASGSRMLVGEPDTVRGVSVKRGALRTRFFGQSSTRVLMNLFEEARNYLAPPHLAQGGTNDVLSIFKKLHKFLRQDYQKSLAPITVFVDSMMPVLKRMSDVMPSKAACDRLMASYTDTSETIYRIVHMPTFTEQYNLYWDGKLQSESFLPQLLAVLSIASRFETRSKGLGHERGEGVHIPTACALVRTWLDGLRGKQLVELATLQVEILLLHAQRMITPRTQDSWTQLGSIVRMAMTMGLHRDPSEFEPRMTVFVGEIRRRLWFTILDMDLHLSLACNLPCSVRDGHFSCRPPRNLDDMELYPDMKELPPTKPIDQLTDNQMQVYAAMTLGIRMKVEDLVNRTDTVHDYQDVLELGSKLDHLLEDINYIFPRHGILNDTQRSKQWRSRVILDMHIRRPLLALYRPYAIGASDAPAQISRAYLRSSMVILKYLDEIDPLLAHFQDISDMYHQILKRDIIQATLSVCFYIRSATRPASEGSALGQQALRMSPDSTDDYPQYAPDNLMLWSPTRLIGAVEKTLELLIKNIGGSDTKDILCLAVVILFSKNPDPKEEDIVRGLRTVLDACLRAVNMSAEKLAMAPAAATPVDVFQADSYMYPRMPHLYRGARSIGLPTSVSDFDGWDLWDGWE